MHRKVETFEFLISPLASNNTNRRGVKIHMVRNKIQIAEDLKFEREYLEEE